MTELGGNMTVGFVGGCAATFFFGRRSFFRNQGLFIGLATGYTIDNTRMNFKNLDCEILKKYQQPTYSDYFFDKIGHR